MTQKTVLLFDIGNVFFFGDHKLTALYLKNHFDIPISINDTFFSIPQYRQFSEGKLTEDEFVIALQIAFQRPDISKIEFQNAHDVHIVKVIKSAIEVLEKIQKDRLYNIAFLTDINEWSIRRENELYDLSKFSNIFIRSCEEGYTKKSPELFIIAQKKLSGYDIIFIDDLPANINVAEKLGIKSILVDRNGENLKYQLQSHGLVLA